MADLSTDAELKSWLNSRVRSVSTWTTLSWSAGLTALLAAVLQAWCLASFFSGWLFDHRSFSELALWWWLLPASIALRALANAAKEEAGIRSSAVVRTQLRADLVEKIGTLGPAWKTTQASGDLASKLHEQVDGLDAYVGRYLPQQKLAAAGPLLLLAIVFPFNWVCGLILLATAPLIPLFMILIGLGAQAVQTRQLRSLSRMSGHFLALLRGMTTLRLINAHRDQEASVAAVSEGFRVRTMEVLRLAFLSSTMLEFFSVLAIALTALYLGFTLLGEINFGVPLTFSTALFVLLLAPDFYQPLRDLGTLYHARAEALACAAQLKPLLDARSPSPTGGSIVLASKAPTFRVESLSFSYGEVPVLNNLTFAVPEGTTLAVTGPSGVGKTTLLRLLQGQLAPTTGRILVGGHDLLEADLEHWRSSLGWLSQHPRLWAASLADNLRLARRDASETDLVQSLQWAGLQDWFEGLERGLDTPLGEGGRAVSGGQLRRLALARLRLRPATVLLLDEPTASLDDATQDLVLARLAEWKKGKTTVLLTHHPRPLALADQILDLSPLPVGST